MNICASFVLINYLLNGKIQIDSCGYKRRKGGNEEILFTYCIQIFKKKKKKKRSQQLEKEKGGARGERVRGRRGNGRAGRRRQGKGRSGR